MLIKMAEQRPPTVGEVLELEFSRLRATGRHGPLETQQQKAEFLKLDKASLNRFQNGRRELTRKRALDIARHLRNRSDDDAEVRELADRLLVARRDATADQVQVETFSHPPLRVAPERFAVAWADHWTAFIAAARRRK